MFTIMDFYTDLLTSFPAGPICSLSNPSACGGQAETTTEVPETESTTPGISFGSSSI